METNALEIRNTSIECRAIDENGKRFIDGYAILYDHPSRMLFERGDYFIEVINRGALDEILKQENLDVIATPNHTYSQVLGRTISGTLQLINDSKGLRYKVEIPDTSFGNDIYQSIKRGDTFESSFTFAVDAKGQSWSKNGEGANLRTINKISMLKEVSPVTFAAYSDTKVAARSFENFQTIEKPVEKPVDFDELDLYKRKLTLKNL